MHLSRAILFILWGGWAIWVDGPALANPSAEQAMPQLERTSKRSTQRKSRQSQTSNSDDLPPQVGGRSAGSRGCMVETKTVATHTEIRDRLPALMLLAPLDRIAQTQASQPLLAWYLRDSSPNPFIFRLYEVEGGFNSDSLNDPQQAWTLLTEVTLPSKDKSLGNSTQSHTAAQAGISVLKLSALPHPFKLRVGGSYVWQVEMICDPERPSRNLFAQAGLKVVAPSKQNLARPKATVLTDLLEKGLWQDALTISLENSGKSLPPSTQVILDSVVIDQGELEALQQATVHH